MSKAVSRGQALEVSSRIGSQVDWDEIDGDSLQKEVISLSPEEFGRRFTAFLKNGARFIVGALVLLVSRDKQFNPASFIGKGWAIWKGLADSDGLAGDEQQDARSLALTEVDWNKVLFPICLKEKETSITGEEKLNRLQASGEILLDAKIGEALWLDFQANGESSILERLWREHGVVYLDFFGTILRYPLGFRCVLYLFYDVGQWHWHFHWLGLLWHADHGSATLASLPPAEVPTEAVAQSSGLEA